MRHPFAAFLSGLGLALMICAIPADAILFSGAPVSSSATLITSLLVFNSSGGTISNQPTMLALNLAKGDVPTGSKIQLRKNDGVTVVATQEDGTTTWVQDGSRKIVVLPFIEPDSITTATSATYKVYAVSGSPNTTPNLAPSDIIAHTNIILKSTTSLFPSTGTGTPETGTWDFLGVNYVLGNCQQYNSSTGYGADPICGWDVTGTGPNRYALHLFQYARRESSVATHNWLRTDMWVDFWGSSATPCPCSVSAIISLPNIWGAITGGTIGGATMSGYVFGASLFNGANVIGSNFGGSNDARVQTVTFDHTFGATGGVVLAGGGWLQDGVCIPSQPIMFTGGTMPTGLTASQPYFFNGYCGTGATTYALNAWYSLDAGHAVTITTNGAATITATPLVAVSPWTSVVMADTTGKRLWIAAAGTSTTPPPVLNAQEFTYLTQSGHAIPPLIKVSNGVTLWNNMPSQIGLAASHVYYPNSWYTNLDTGNQGDDPSDNRIGYLDRPGAISLYAPFDTAAVQNSDVFGASFNELMVYLQDEHVGLPPVFNAGPLKDTTTKYPTLGANQPTVRVTYNSAGLGWTTPATVPAGCGGATVDTMPVCNRYLMMEMSHTPSPQQAPYLRTGEAQWQWEMAGVANSSVSTLNILKATIAGTDYYRAPAGWGEDNQTRAVAWQQRAEDQAQFFMPDADPLHPYLTDLVSDSYAQNNAVVANNLTAPELSLGYFWTDVRNGAGGGAGGNGTYQWWQDDFVWESYALEAIRNEFSAATTFTTGYFYKQVIGRMDANNSYGGGAGCLWVVGAHVVNPFAIPPSGGTSWSLATLPTTWNAFYTNVTAQYGTHLNGQTSGTTLTVNSLSYPGTAGIGGPFVGQVITGTSIPANTTVLSGSGVTWTLSNSSSIGAEDMVVSGQWDAGVWAAGNSGNPPWAGCAAQASTTWNTVIRDTTDSNPTVPNGYMNIGTASAGIAAWLGLADVSTIYGTLRTYAYGGTCPTCGGVPLNFRQFHTSGGDFTVPQFAIGPAGAVN